MIATRRPFLIGIVLVALLVLVATTPVWSQSSRLRLIQGESKKVGNGLVSTWVKVQDSSGIPDSIGITITPGALEGLPADHEQAQADSLKLKLIDGSPHHNFEYELMFPPEADRTAFSHMGFNWNPEGHGPLPGVFFRPHFDVHFYMATPAYRHSITNENLTDLHVQNIEPPRDFLPATYERAPNTSEPRMGTHYADMSSEQLKPGKFTNIFLFGGHNGNILFWEPMLTRDYLLSKPQFSAAIPQPKAYPVSGYYPLSYSVKHDRKTGNINVSLDRLTLRASSYPGNVYGVSPCLDSRLAKIILTYRQAKPASVEIPADCKVLVPLIERQLNSQT
ncbi:MAG: DUF5602 domain-containing protein [Synechococcus sp.]|nr:DUF5602 domain-containing protein [Synechococcus sp.]